MRWVFILAPALVFGGLAALINTILGVVVFVLFTAIGYDLTTHDPTRGEHAALEYYGDTTLCRHCGQAWDTNDPCPPKCKGVL